MSDATLVQAFRQANIDSSAQVAHEAEEMAGGSRGTQFMLTVYKIGCGLDVMCVIFPTVY